MVDSIPRFPRWADVIKQIDHFDASPLAGTAIIVVHFKRNQQLKSIISNIVIVILFCVHRTRFFDYFLLGNLGFPQNFFITLTNDGHNYWILSDSLEWQIGRLGANWLDFGIISDWNINIGWNCKTPTIPRMVRPLKSHKIGGR